MHRKSQINYEGNKMIDGDIGIENDIYNMSLSSSVKQFSTTYVKNVILAFAEKMNGIEPSEQSSEESQSPAIRLKVDDLTTQINEAPGTKINLQASTAKRLISDSESASVDDFDQDDDVVDGGFFAQVCTNVIGAKVKQVLKSMTGIENVLSGNKTNVVINTKSEEDESPVSSNKQHTRNTILSSTVSQGAVVAAQDYLVNVYNQAAKAVINSNKSNQIEPSPVLDSEGNVIEFVREITEESLQNSGKQCTFRTTSIILIHMLNLTYHLDIPEIAKDYLGEILDKLDDIEKEVVLTDESFDLSDTQQNLIDTYIKKLYAKGEAEAVKDVERENYSALSMSLTASNKEIAEKYLKEVYGKAEIENVGGLTSRRAPSESEEDEEEDEEYFPAPSINVIQDNTQFLVSKHLLGIKQDGYENAFFPSNVVVNHLPDKARAMSAKGNRSSSQPSQRSTPKSKVKETDEEYIQAVLKGSFPEQEKKLEPEKPIKKVSKINKQPTLINKKINVKSNKKTSDSKVTKLK